MGHVPNVVFTCGAIPEDDGTVKIYWNGADTVMSAGTAVINDLVASVSAEDARFATRRGDGTRQPMV